MAMAVDECGQQQGTTAVDDVPAGRLRCRNRLLVIGYRTDASFSQRHIGPTAAGQHHVDERVDPFGPVI